MSGYPTLAERLAVAHAGGRNGVTPGFPPPDEPRAITAALQAIYESARGNTNGARAYAKLAVRLARSPELCEHLLAFIEFYIDSPIVFAHQDASAVGCFMRETALSGPEFSKLILAAIAQGQDS